VLPGLPQGRAGHTATRIGDLVVVVGGFGGGFVGQLDTSVVAAVNADGTLAPWREGPRLPRSTMHHICDAWRTHLYCVGGRAAGNLTHDMVAHAVLEGDELGAFTSLAGLSGSRGFHESFVHGDSLYLVSGLRRDASSVAFEALVDVQRAQLDESTGLGPFSEAGLLPDVWQVSAAAPFQDRVYLVGGMTTDDAVSDEVVAINFDRNGHIGSVDVLAARVPRLRMHVHHTPVHDGRLYSAGGRDHSGRSLGAIDIGTFR
jgi:hypothetical protein